MAPEDPPSASDDLPMATQAPPLAPCEDAPRDALADLAVLRLARTVLANMGFPPVPRAEQLPVSKHAGQRILSALEQQLRVMRMRSRAQAVEMPPVDCTSATDTHHPSSECMRSLLSPLVPCSLSYS